MAFIYLLDIRKFITFLRENIPQAWELLSVYKIIFFKIKLCLEQVLKYPFGCVYFFLKFVSLKVILPGESDQAGALFSVKRNSNPPPGGTFKKSAVSRKFYIIVSFFS